MAPNTRAPKVSKALPSASLHKKSRRASKKHSHFNIIGKHHLHHKTRKPVKADELVNAGKLKDGIQCQMTRGDLNQEYGGKHLKALNHKGRVDAMREALEKYVQENNGDKPKTVITRNPTASGFSLEIHSSHGKVEKRILNRKGGSGSILGKLTPHFGMPHLPSTKRASASANGSALGKTKPGAKVDAAA